MKEGRPQAFVEGEIGDGCTKLESITQARTGNVVTLAVTSVRQGERCTMIMQLLNRWVPLDGVSAQGDYAIRANSARVDFKVAAASDGTLRIEPDPGPLPN